MQEQHSFSRRILPLTATHFSGIFNDNAFKLIVLLALCGSLTNSIINGLWFLIFTAACLIPAVLFGAPAGYFADRIPKR